MVGQRTYKVSKAYKGSRRKIGAVLILVILVVSGSALYLNTRNLQSDSIIPVAIKKNVSFVIFYPKASPTLKLNASSIKFDPPSGLVSFTANHAGVNLTFAEQATPESFVDIPPAYDKLIETLNEYATFNSFYDTVHLTKPKELNGQQSAVMNSKGTLMFVNTTNGSLTDDQWKSLFNNLEVIR